MCFTEEGVAGVSEARACVIRTAYGKGLLVAGKDGVPCLRMNLSELHLVRAHDIELLVVQKEPSARGPLVNGAHPAARGSRHCATRRSAQYAASLLCLTDRVSQVLCVPEATDAE